MSLPAPALAGAAVLGLAALIPRTDLAANPQDRAAPAAGTGAVDYLREVRPILAQHCYGCHGPDEERREADLRLDLREEVFADRGGYAAVAPGAPGDSELLLRVLDDLDPMPPAGEGDPLSDEQKELLRRWVAEGAPWPEHWAFAPPRRRAPPEPAGGDWVREPIDAFVLGRLEEAGLEPAPEAGREAWLRRVSFDLTGLPPTPAELDAFLADESEQAYERQVERLLASPRYGERQAQDWLDLARYADTSGFQFDTPRRMWKWREWVIEAFNAHMPFDQFTVEQLAGDLLPNPSTAQLVATGFNRNHPSDTDGPSEMDEFRTQYVVDRVHTTATTWMGLTLSCAQCHDHKYDPFTQEDFYSFYSFFNNVAERDVDFGNPRPNLRVPSPDQAPLLADLDRRIAVLEERLEGPDPLFDAEQRRWEREARERLGEPVEWDVLEPVGLLSRNGARLRAQDDGSILSTGPTPVTDVYDLVIQPGARRVEALRLEVLPQEGDPRGRSGRAADGSFKLTSLELRESSLSDGEEPPLVYVALAQADLEQPRNDDADEWELQPGSIASAIALPADEDDEDGGGGGFGWGRGGWRLVGEARAQRREAVLLPLEPLELNDASLLKITMRQESGGRQRSLVGRFRWSATDDPRIRAELLPMAPKLWSVLGPFPAADVAAAFATEYAPEGELEDGLELGREYEQPAPPEPRRADAPPERADEGERDAEADAADEPRDERDGDREEAGEREEDEEPRPPLEWKEKRSWRDGERQRLAPGTAAWYLTRQVVTDRPRTAVLRLDGPAGVRAWLNGELVFEDAPEPPAPPAEDDAEDAGDGDDDDFFFVRREDRPERTVRLGFRAGANELVVKAVYAAPEEGEGRSRGRRRGGASLTFDLTPEGDDLLTHELATALRGAEPDGDDGDDGDAIRAARTASVPDAPRDPAAPAPEGAPAPEPRPTTAALRRDKLREHFRRRVSPVGVALDRELERLRDERRELERRLPETLVMMEREEPRQAHVLVRGDFRRKGAPVAPATPAALPPMAPELPRNRLGLARWLVSGEHPLTARVAANRVWQQFFGKGLVDTPDDFGVRAELPSHPALLDWLAVELVEGGWSLQALQRRIALSATYRQAAVATPEKREADPENRLLSRGPRVRLSAEMVRDNALAVSGLLVEELGGKSVRPYQAPGVWKDVTGGGEYERDTGPAQYRRGLYVYWKRRVPYPSMLAFDASKREVCTAQRATTNTPLQALVLLNNPVYVEAAKQLGARMARAAGDDAARLRHGFRLCTSRFPSDAELAVLTELLEAQRAGFDEDEEAAAALLAVGDSEVRADEELDACELAAWAAVAGALLNMDATIHKG